MFPLAVNYISQNAFVSVLHTRRDRLGAREAFKCVPPDSSAAHPAPVPSPLREKDSDRERHRWYLATNLAIATRPTPFQEFCWVGSHFSKSLRTSLWNLTLGPRPFVLLVVSLSTSLRGPVSIKHDKRGDETQRFI